MNYQDEYLSVRQHLHDVSLKLMWWEKKTWVKAGVSRDGYSTIVINSQKFYLVETNTFRQVSRTALLESSKKYPKNFGLKNSIPILHALHKHDPVYLKLKDSIRFFSQENFCYIVPINSDLSIGKTLRIDLFRKLDKRNSEKSYDFTGGLMHCLKHISIQDQLVGVNKKAYSIDSVEDLLFQIIRTFYFPTRISQKIQKPNSIEHEAPFRKYNKRMICGFYHEANCDVYFLNTAYIKSI